MIVTQIASGLNTPHLPTRKLLLDILVFLVYWNEGQAHDLVLNALVTLSEDNHERGSTYSYWFKSFEQALIGRGRMGTFVGASEEVKRHGGHDPSLNDYTASLLTAARMEFIYSSLRTRHLISSSSTVSLRVSMILTFVSTIDPKWNRQVYSR